MTPSTFRHDRGTPRVLAALLSLIAVLGVLLAAPQQAGAVTRPGAFATATYRGGDTLWADQTLQPGQYVMSPDGRFALIMQTDGNLVEYGPEQRSFVATGPYAWWATGTGGQPGNRAVMQSDGNLVVYRPNNTVAWASNSYRSGATRLTVKNDGNMVMIRNDGSSFPVRDAGYRLASPFTWAGTWQLTSGQSLAPDRYLTNGRYRLLLQTDGNLILYGPAFHVLWQTGAMPASEEYCGRKGLLSYSYRAVDVTMQSDGNLVMNYIERRTATSWATDPVDAPCGSGTTETLRSKSVSATSGPGNLLALQSDGNLVVYNSSGAPLWATNTAGQV